MLVSSVEEEKRENDVEKGYSTARLRDHLSCSRLKPRLSMVILKKHLNKRETARDISARARVPRLVEQMQRIFNSQGLIDRSRGFCAKKEGYRKAHVCELFGCGANECSARAFRAPE